MSKYFDLLTLSMIYLNVITVTLVYQATKYDESTLVLGSLSLIAAYVLGWYHSIRKQVEDYKKKGECDV